MALSVANATHSQFDRGLQGQALEQLQVGHYVPLVTFLLVALMAALYRLRLAHR